MLGLYSVRMLTTWAATALAGAACLAGAVVVGRLGGAVYGRPSRLLADPRAVGRQLGDRVWVAGMVWAALAAACVPLTLAVQLQVPLGQANSPAQLVAYVVGVRLPFTLTLTAVGAVAVSVAALRVRTLGGWALLHAAATGLVCLVGLSVNHGGLLDDHSLPFLVGLGAVGGLALWVGAVWDLRGQPFDDPGRDRHLRATAWYAGAVAVGVTALVVLRSGSWALLGFSRYGQASLVVLALVWALAGARAMGVRWVTSAGTSLLVALSLLLVAVSGLLVALPPTTDGAGPRTIAEQLLGGSIPPPVSVGRLLVPASDLVCVILSVAAVTWYLVAVHRLRAAGRPWSRWRTSAWVAGWALVLSVTATGVGTYASVLFSVHMVQHTALNMVAPMLLVLGGPITLALEVLPPAPPGDRGAREWLIELVGSRVVRALTHPVVAFVLFVAGLFVLYMTSVFSWLMAQHLGHVGMVLAFLVVGYLYYWTAIGVDPTPSPVSLPVRVAEMVGGMMLQTVFGVTVMVYSGRLELFAGHALAGGWYATVAPAWQHDLLHDQFVGGLIAALSTEVWDGAVVAILILAVWGSSRWWSATPGRSRRISPSAVTGRGRRPGGVGLDPPMASAHRLIGAPQVAERAPGSD